MQHVSQLLRTTRALMRQMHSIEPTCDMPSRSEELELPSLFKRHATCSRGDSISGPLCPPQEVLSVGWEAYLLPSGNMPPGEEANTWWYASN